MYSIKITEKYYEYNTKNTYIYTMYIYNEGTAGTCPKAKSL